MSGVTDQANSNNFLWSFNFKSSSAKKIANNRETLSAGNIKNIIIENIILRLYNNNKMQKFRMKLVKYLAVPSEIK